MDKELTLRLTPEQAADDAYIVRMLASQTGSEPGSFHFRWKKRSVDARKKNILVNATFELSDKPFPSEIFFTARDVSGKAELHIVGAGPAGLFAALRAIELGLRPIVYERGKDVRSRRRDLARLNREGIVDPESNYCFGEGGAGTYSDGKLYTRSKKRGDVLKTLEWFVHFGADRDILVDAHPHIGTNKLPRIIEEIRETIRRSGGEVHFDSKLTDLHIEAGKIVSVTVNEKTVPVRNLVLATGHSARDIFELLHRRGVTLKAKPFALGVRIEHTQELIDRIQYHGRLSDDFLPPASYALVTQADGRGVYSFCMCPGGIIAPCATASDEVVTNGWSPSKRNNPYANSGIVVGVFPADFENAQDPFACLDFQRSVEHACWKAGGCTQKVPAQRLIDFIERRKSKDFPRSSYQPGIVSADLNEILPPLVAGRLRSAFRDFGRKMNGFLTNDAVLHAPESRTSSPVQIPRDPESFCHPEVNGLYPCAEGAGYAGGIVSAAIDGMNCADAVFRKLQA